LKSNASAGTLETKDKTNNKIPACTRLAVKQSVEKFRNMFSNLYQPISKKYRACLAGRRVAPEYYRDDDAI
jgi:hypothetical protein